MSRHERLLAELETYASADAAEERHRVAMLALLSSAGAFSRAHFAPGHFTASCYILDPDDRMLFHHHRRLNRWLQMGGHVEALSLSPRADAGISGAKVDAEGCCGRGGTGDPASTRGINCRKIRERSLV
jgi:hypothetical protein